MARLAPFTKSFTQQEPLPPAAIEAAVAVMQSGALHRYGANPSRAAELEHAYAQWLPATFCLATASGGQTGAHLRLGTEGDCSVTVRVRWCWKPRYQTISSWRVAEEQIGTWQA